LVIAVRLYQPPRGNRLIDLALAEAHVDARRLTQAVELFVVDVFLVALGETEHEDGALFRAEGNQRPVASRAALPSPRDTLLDDPAAEIGIDEAAGGALHRLAQCPIRNSFIRREAPEGSRLEDPHCAPAV